MRISRSFAVVLTAGLTAAAIAPITGCTDASGDRSLSDIQPATLPDAQAGQRYSVQLSAATVGPDCDGVPSFELGEDRLEHQTPTPTGLHLFADGQLTGTPTTAGEYEFSVWATIGCHDSSIGLPTRMVT